MCNLGIAYINGIGTKVCPELGVYWFKKASDKGHVKATVNVGYCYANGCGVEKNPTLAVEYYKRAALENNALNKDSPISIALLIL